MRGIRTACALLLALAVPAVAIAAPSSAGGPAVVTAAASAGHPTAVDIGSTGIEISAVTPVVAGPGEPVTIRGTLDVAALDLDLSSTVPTAPSDDDDAAQDDDPPTVAVVEVRSAPTPVRTHTDVAAWGQSSAPSDGRLLRSQPVEAPASGAATTVPFAVTVADPRGGREAAYGVAPVSLQVYRPGEVTPAGVVHTFLGYQERKEYVPLAFTVLVPFVVPADAALVGEFGPERVAAWEQLVGPDGVLRERLERATGPSIAWALDPALLTSGPGAPPTPTADDAESTDESTAPGGEGTTTSPPTDDGATEVGAADAATDDPAEEPTDEVPATGPAAREAQLRGAYATALLEAARGVEVLVLPTHDADLGALTAGDDPATQAQHSVLGSGLDITPAMEQLGDAGARAQAVAWPADGRWSPDQDGALHELAADAPWGVLLHTDQVTGRPTGPVTGPSGGSLLPYDPAVSERASTVAQDSVASGLALMADTLVALNESPGLARHRVIALDRYASATPDIDAVTALLEEVPWVSLEPMPDASRAGALVESLGDDSGDGTAAPALTQERAVALIDTRDQLATAATVRAGDGQDLARRGADTLDQLASARWRAAPDDWDRVYQPIAEDVRSTFTSLRIPPRDITFLADSGVMRVTVENSLDDGIRNATLELTVDRPILRIESGPQPVDVGGMSRSTVGFDATAIASGRVSVTAIVRAADGTALSEPSTFEVRVSPTASWIYWVLGALGGLIILIGVIRTVRRRQSA